MDVIFILFWTFFFIFLMAILGTLAYGGISAAPWVPLWKKDTLRMLQIAQVKPGEKVVDLGAGDARIIIAAAKNYDAKGIGYELAILPYFIGWVKIIMSGLRGKPSIKNMVRGKAILKYCNFFKVDLSDADVICAFLTPAAMAKLKPKFEKEIKPGCRIVSYAFKIPDWQPTKIDKPNKKTTAIYLYQR